MKTNSHGPRVHTIKRPRARDSFRRKDLDPKLNEARMRGHASSQCPHDNHCSGKHPRNPAKQGKTYVYSHHQKTIKNTNPAAKSSKTDESSTSRSR